MMIADRSKRKIVLQRKIAYRSAGAGRQRRAMQKKVLLGLLVFAVFTFVKVWQKTNVDYQYRRNDRLQMELKILRAENALWQVEIEELRAVERLTAIAAEKLHLVHVPKINLQEKNAFDKLTAKVNKLHK